MPAFGGKAEMANGGRAPMRQDCGLGLAMLVGGALGAAAVTGLHAQAKPPVYLVSEIEVTNPAAYGAEFAPQAQAAIKAAGGRLIAIGGVAGAGAKPLIAITGTPPKRVAIQQWDSLERLNGSTVRSTKRPLESAKSMQRSADTLLRA